MNVTEEVTKANVFKPKIGAKNWRKEFFKPFETYHSVQYMSREK